MKNFTLLFEELGLTENESQAYEYLLMAGPHTAAETAAKTGIKRSNAYHVLAKLEEYDLVKSGKHGSKTRFEATHPDNLQNLVKKKRNTLDDVSDKISLALPDLTDRFNLTAEVPGVYSFTGKEGIEKALTELLNEKSTVYRFENTTDMWSLFPDLLTEFGNKRVKTGTDIKILTSATAKERDSDKKRLREVRHLDPKKIKFSMDINITDNKVVMTTFDKKNAVGIVIVHKEIVNNYKMLFDFFWASSK